MLDELVRLGAGVDQRPGDVAVRARSLWESACGNGAQREAAVGATLLARAQRNLGEVDAAAWAIAQALEHGVDVGGQVLADAHLVAASIVTFRRGDEEAMRHLDQAERHGDRAMRTQVRLQRAVLAKRAGRLDEAIEIYRHVLPELRAAGDAIVTARVLSNRGSIMVLRGRVDAALRDFDEARSLFEDAGQDLGVAVVTENIAWAHVTRGDIPAALALLDATSAQARRLGHRLQDAAISRAEALMAAGLFGDASDVLAQVVRTLTATGDRAGTAEALLVRAEALRLAGRPSSACARRAHELFVGLGARGFASQAELEALRATVRDDGRADIDRAEQLAAELESAGSARSAVDAWSLVTTLALAAGDLRRARAAARRCARRACAVPFVEHRLAAAVAVAATTAAAGDEVGAIAAVERALTDFDRYRAEIGSPDARSGSAQHAAELRSLGATIVGASRDPDRILAWTERRRRAVPAWLPVHDHERSDEQAGRSDERARRSDERAGPADERAGPADELRSVIAELRVAELDGTTPSGRSVDELVTRRTLLERELRDRLLAAGRRSGRATAAGDPPSAELRHRVGVSMDLHGDRLLAVVCSDGTRRLVDLGHVDPIRATARSAHSAIAALAAEARGVGVDVALARVGAATSRLDELAVAPLRLPPGPVVLSVPTELQAAPWSSTPGLRSEAVALASSLGGFEGAAPIDRANVSVVGGPRLRYAAAEVAAVAAIHPGARVRSGRSASGATVRADLESCDIVHVAAHTRVRDDNAMWSTIELDDGPLHLHEIATCDRVPDVVVLSTCRSADPCSASGLPGLARALLELGSRAVIASTSQLADTATTVDVVTTLHRRLASGQEPATALAAARRDHPSSPAVHSFVCWER